jgi:hypothetical protein
MAIYIGMATMAAREMVAIRRVNASAQDVALVMKNSGMCDKGATDSERTACLFMRGY